MEIIAPEYDIPKALIDSGPQDDEFHISSEYPTTTICLRCRNERGKAQSFSLTDCLGIGPL